jgi:hypothetical protein
VVAPEYLVVAPEYLVVVPTTFAVDGQPLRQAS